MLQLMGRAMPLKISTGFKIALVLLPVPTGKVLAVPYFHQQQTNWCWAGCAEMLFHFNNWNTNVKQCDMATAQFGGNCCATPSSSTCNNGNWPENTYNHYGFHYTKVNAALTQTQVDAEINATRPVEVYYAWNGGGAHVALIRGYYPNGDVEVNDPWYGQSRRTYASVLTAYGLGHWTMSYDNLHK